MLTKELIRENSALSGLTDDQITAITELSENDEKIVKNKLYGEVHGMYDERLGKILGVEKPKGGKIFSTDFWTDEVTKLKKTADEAGDTSELDTLKATIADLETKIKEGKGDKTLLEKLEKEKAALVEEKKELTASIEKMRGDVTKIETDYKEKLEVQESKFRDIQVSQYLDQQLTGLKFKDTIPENLQKLAVKSAKASLLKAYEPVQVDDGNGGTTWQFKKDGTIANNPKNGLKPFTGQELLLPHLEEIIDTGKFQPGGGTKPPKPGEKPGVSGDLVDVTGAKTRVQAMDMIKTALASQGISVTDPRYSEIKNKTWKEVVEPMNLPQA